MNPIYIELLRIREHMDVNRSDQGSHRRLEELVLLAKRRCLITKPRFERVVVLPACRGKEPHIRQVKDLLGLLDEEVARKVVVLLNMIHYIRLHSEYKMKQTGADD